MDVISWLAVVSGVVSVLAFVFAIWVWVRSDMKVRELSSTVQALHDICGSILWETQFLPSEGDSSRLSQLDKSLGLISGMRTLTSKYAEKHNNYHTTELGILIERGVLWSTEMLYRLEQSNEVREIWLMTHDLEPDLSDTKTGKIVKKNLDSGKSYKYFYPSQLEDAEAKIWRLRRNIGATLPTLANSTMFIPLDDSPELQIFSPANVIPFFKDEPFYSTDLVFQEVILTQISLRGVFWQEHEKKRARRLLELLRAEVEKMTSTNGE